MNAQSPNRKGTIRFGDGTKCSPEPASPNSLKPGLASVVATVVAPSPNQQMRVWPTGGSRMGNTVLTTVRRNDGASQATSQNKNFVCKRGTPAPRSIRCPRRSSRWDRMLRSRARDEWSTDAGSAVTVASLSLLRLSCRFLRGSVGASPPPSLRRWLWLLSFGPFQRPTLLGGFADGLPASRTQLPFLLCRFGSSR